MKIINTIFSGIFIIVLLLVSSLFLVPLLPITNNIQIKIVESGSMEPTILTGSLVIIKPATSYAVGDIITFTSVSADVPTTHRIVAIREASGQKFFMTKGDANEEADTNETALRSVIGKVALVVPYVGFVLDFARQPIGFGLLIVLPALLIIWSELEKIWREVRKPVARQTKKSIEPNEVIVPVCRPIVIIPVAKVRMMDIARPVAPKVNQMRVIPVVPVTKFSPSSNYVLSSYMLPVVAVLSSVLFTAMSFTGSTVSYFNDIEVAVGNILRASALDFSVTTEENTFVLDTDTKTAVTITPTVSLEGDSAPAAYDVSVEVVSASSTLCDALVVDATLPFLYTGSLSNLTATALVFNDSWALDVSIDSSITYTAGEVCAVNLVYSARRAGTPTTAGYIDIEKVPLQFSTPLPVAPRTELFRASFIPSSDTSLLEDESPILPLEDEVTSEESTTTDSVLPEEVVTPLTSEVVVPETEVVSPAEEEPPTI